MKRARALLGGLFSGCVAVLSACSGTPGEDSDGEDVNQPSPAAIVTIAVAPTTVAQGQEAVLTWMSNAAMCVAGGAWTGAQASSGTLGVSSTTIGNNTYTVTCGDSAHSAMRVFATLDVIAASAFSESSLVVSDGSVTNVAQEL